MVTFEECVERAGSRLTRTRLDTLQVNLGKLCNQACLHCHVEAGPRRTEVMTQAVADRVGAWFAATDIAALDLTGGAPELAPPFRGLVTSARQAGREVIVRHNFTVQQAPGQADLPEFFRAHGVHVVGSLPCYLEENVDAQRGRGAYAGSIAGLRRLNEVGFGVPGTGLRLDLVYNPLGPALPPPQADLRAAYAEHLADQWGIVFNDLLTLTNMPIKRFREQLAREGTAERYHRLLVDSFNPATLPNVMCRSLISVDWQGYVYDCDFNQMLDLPCPAGRRRLWDVAPTDLLREIGTGPHCFACTAGAGSSCGGALV